MALPASSPPNGRRLISSVAPPSPPSKNGAAAGQAFSWSAADVVTRQLVQFITTIVLARLIKPSDFGTVAILLFFSAFGTTVLAGAALTALTQRSENSREQDSVIFWWLLGASVAVSALVVAAGPWMAMFYNLPDLALLSWFAAGQIIATALGTVPTAILARTLRFKSLAIGGLIGNSAAGIAGILLAFEGFGVFALAVQVLLSALVPVFLWWPMAGWTPTLDVHPSKAGTIFKSLGWIAPTSMLTTFASQGYSLVVGRRQGPTELGLYGRAANLAVIPQNIFAHVVGRVALPVFAGRARDGSHLAADLLQLVRMASFFYLPVMLGMIACPTTIVTLLFGQQWTASAPLLGILALAGLFHPVKILNANLLLATGRADRVFRIELIEKGLAVILTLAASFIGLAALAWSQVLAAGIGLFFVGRAAKDAVGTGLGQQFREIAPLLVAGAAMALFANRLDAALDLAVAPRLGLTIALSALVYFGAVALLSRRTMGELRAWLSSPRQTVPGQ